MAAQKTTLLQITEAAPILQASGIPIKEGRPSGSRRFVVERKTDGERVGEEREGKTDNTRARRRRGGRNLIKKGKKDIQSLKTVL